MICFLITSGHAYTLKDVLASRLGSRIRVLTYGEALQERWFPKATYVFCDIDRLDFDQRERAARLYLRMRAEGFRVLNSPARALTRFPLLRTLHRTGINQFRVFTSEDLEVPMRFPVYLRSRHEHQYPVSDLLHSREALQDAWDKAVQEGMPLEHLMVIEYAGEPVRPGVFRKLSAFCIDGQIFHHTTVHDSQWLVKKGRLNVADDREYQEEAQLLQSNPHQELLSRVFSLAAIDYGRVDYGLWKGMPQIFEINTNPHVFAPWPHPHAQRRQNLEKAFALYLEALSRLDVPPDGTLRRWRRDRTEVERKVCWRDFFRRRARGGRGWK